jgi:hypothetical protein
MITGVQPKLLVSFDEEGNMAINKRKRWVIKAI